MFPQYITDLVVLEYFEMYSLLANDHINYMKVESESHVLMSSQLTGSIKATTRRTARIHCSAQPFSATITDRQTSQETAESCCF